MARTNTNTGGGGGGGSPGGTNTDVQFNDNGNFGGDSHFQFNKTTQNTHITKGLTGNDIAEFILNDNLASTGISGAGLHYSNSDTQNMSLVAATRGDAIGATGIAIISGAFNNSSGNQALQVSKITDIGEASYFNDVQNGSNVATVSLTPDKALIGFSGDGGSTFTSIGFDSGHAVVQLPNSGSYFIATDMDSVSYLTVIPQNKEIIIGGLQSFEGTNPVFSGTGLDDFTYSGTFTGITTTNYIVTIDGVNIDCFQYTGAPSGSFNTGDSLVDTTSGATGTVSGVDEGSGAVSYTITSGTFFQTGDTVQNTTSGHIVSNISALGQLDTFSWTDGSITKTGVPTLTNALMSNGISGNFNSDTGHTLNDSWSFAFNPLYGKQANFDGVGQIQEIGDVDGIINGYTIRMDVKNGQYVFNALATAGAPEMVTVDSTGVLGKSAFLGGSITAGQVGFGNPSNNLTSSDTLLYDATSLRFQVQDTTAHNWADFNPLGGYNSLSSYFAYVSSTNFKGGGLDDGLFSGIYTGISNSYVYKVKIDGVGTENFQLTGSSGSPTPGDSITSSSGGSGTIVSYDLGSQEIKITNITGTFLVGDTVTSTSVSGTISVDAGMGEDTFSWEDGLGNTGAWVQIQADSLQLLNNGINISFVSDRGHTLNDEWDANFTSTAQTGLVTDFFNQDFWLGDKNFITQGQTIEANNKENYSSIGNNDTGATFDGRAKQITINAGGTGSTLGLDAVTGTAIFQASLTSGSNQPFISLSNSNSLFDFGSVSGNKFFQIDYSGGVNFPIIRAGDLLNLGNGLKYTLNTNSSTFRILSTYNGTTDARSFESIWTAGGSGITSIGDIDLQKGYTRFILNDDDQTISLLGNIVTNKTITAPGTTGDRTINTTSGSVNFAALDSSLTVTNSLVNANSVIIVTVASNDVSMQDVFITQTSGSFTIYPNSAPTSETRVNFIIIN